MNCIRTKNMPYLFYSSLAELVNVIKNETTVKDEDVEQQEVEKHVAEIGNEVNSVGTKEDDDLLLPGTTLFVKNLSFKTTDERLKNKFESRLRIRSVTVSKKRGEFFVKLYNWYIMEI
ncbi:unnamed protein product, partial [Onchocerca ochengi]|uniref:RRM domain-containing protein n=1 Tax=Onchocerca ochengi TaxID=42157 RepID=A0A182EZ72_ONCOC